MKKLATLMLLSYFRYLAKLQLSKNRDAIIIGVTGSSGKSSLCLALAHILKLKGVVKQSGFANSESGIPLNILGLRPTNYNLFDWLRLAILAPIKLLTNWEHFDYYIIEMGIDSPDEPKNMSYLLKIVRPHVGVVLSVGLAHAGAFDHLVRDKDPHRRQAKLTYLIAKEKMKLVSSIAKAGISVINIDQKELKTQKNHIKSRLITIGTGKQAMLRLVSSKVSQSGSLYKLSYQGKLYTLTLQDVFAPHYGYTFAAALAVSTGLGMHLQKAIDALAKYHAPPGRFTIFAGLGDTTIIDSSYNASPQTMHESLELLSKLALKGRRIAVLGDMRELGSSTKQAHRDLSNWIAANCDEVLLFGDYTREHTLPRLIGKQFPAHHFTHMTNLIEYLKKRLTKEAWILVKGSQNEIFLERAVDALLADRKDVMRLCRRGAYWDALRAKAP